jgi:hypothetical protein
MNNSIVQGGERIYIDINNETIERASTFTLQRSSQVLHMIVVHHAPLI